MDAAESSVTQANFTTEMFARAFVRGFDVKPLRFATSRPGRYRLEWRLRLGPGFTVTLELTDRDNENLELHATCCWWIDGRGIQCVAINDGFDATATLPVVRRAKIADPGLSAELPVHYGKIFVEIFIDEKLQPLKQFTDDLASIYRLQRFSDVTLVTKGKEFQVHRLILSASSRVFASMLSADVLERRSIPIELHDVEADVLEQLLNFIYMDKRPSDDFDNWTKLLMVADRFSMNELKDVCVDAMTRNLCVKNAADILVVADTVDIQDLRHRALNFILQNREKVRLTPGYLRIIRSYTTLRREILTRKILNGKK